MSNTTVITGANRGIGLAMVKQCQQNGDTVYALCRQSSPELSSLNVNVIDNVDITTSEGVEKATKALAGITIDLLINNAGILRDESLANFNIDTITEQFNVNALAPLVLTQALLDNFSAGSKIAFITSRMGSVADNGSGGRYGYFTLPHLINKTCRFFYMAYIIYKATWKEYNGIKERILNHEK
jgi:short-subunit dehydrogenase